MMLGISQHGIPMVFSLAFSLAVGVCGGASAQIPDSQKPIEHCEDIAQRYPGAGAYTGLVWVVRDQAKVYGGPDKTAGQIPVRLGFGQRYNIGHAQAGRLLLRENQRDVGWVDHADLACRQQPLRITNSPIDTRFFVKTTATARSSDRTTVKATPTPDVANTQAATDMCARLEAAPAGSGAERPARCSELGRFTPFFIYAIEDSPTGRRFLLSDDQNLRYDSQLKGWVFEKDGFLWETATGVRGSEALKARNETACAYFDVSDLDKPLSAVGCPVTIGGGDIWYTLSTRIAVLSPLLKTSGGRNYYEVMAPLADVPGARNGQQVRAEIAPESLAYVPRLQTALDPFRKIDVHFLVDGTASMQPNIDAIRGRGNTPGVVQQIVDRLLRTESSTSRGAQFRFSFQVYRDQYAGDQEFAPAYSANDTACERREPANDSEERRNRATFAAQLANLNASTDDQTRGDTGTDRFHENFYGGIQKSLDALRSCPDHYKLMIVIGDAGYSDAAERFKGRTPIDPVQLVQRMRGNPEQGNFGVVPVFIRTTRSTTPKTYQEEYDRAYRDFAEQGLRITTSALQTEGNRPAQPGRPTFNPADHVLDIGDAELAERILSLINAYSNQTRLDRFESLLLSDGQAVNAAIEALQADAANAGAPVVLWNQMRMAACAALRASGQCDRRIIDDIRKLYLPFDEKKNTPPEERKIDVDLWLSVNDAGQWITTLNRAVNNWSSGTTNVRQNILGVLGDALTTIINQPFMPKSRQKILDVMATQSRVPFRADSPLLSFEKEELENADSCILDLLPEWLGTSAKMLLAVSRNTKPVAKFRDRSEVKGCRYPRALDIPAIDGDVKEVPLTNGHRYNHKHGKMEFYWMPAEFLP